MGLFHVNCGMRDTKETLTISDFIFFLRGLPGPFFLHQRSRYLSVALHLCGPRLCGGVQIHMELGVAGLCVHFGVVVCAVLLLVLDDDLTFQNLWAWQGITGLQLGREGDCM